MIQGYPELVPVSYKRAEGHDKVARLFFFSFGAFRYPLHRAAELTLASGNRSDNQGHRI